MLARLVTLGLGASLAFAACGGGDAVIGRTSAAALTCDAVDASTTCATDGEAFDAILPILTRSCLPCHDSTAPDATWPLTNYEVVQAWSDVIEGDVLRCSMPPADGGVSITNADRLALVNWAICNQ